MLKYQKAAVFFAALTSFCKAIPALATTYSFTTINIPGSTSASGFGINDAGQIVGEYADSNGQAHGFIDTSGVITTLSAPDAGFTEASGITNAGEVVGTYLLSPPSFLSVGFSWQNGVFTAISAPGATETGVSGINNVGQIIGYYQTPLGLEHGYVDTNGLFSTLDVPNTIATLPTGINDNGEIVGFYQSSYAPGPQPSFVYTNGAFTTLAAPQPLTASGINNLGQIVGKFDSPPYYGFVDADGTFTTLDVPGSDVTEAYGINDSGVVVGGYTQGSGAYAFIATPVSTAPEPSSVADLAAPLLVLSFIVCRSRRRSTNLCI